MHKKYPKNISIIDKLVLAIVKTFNVDEATAWVEGKKQDLIKLDTVTENAFNEISENKGIEIAKFIKNISPDNMYILCKSKISEVGELINSNGALYLDCESALPYYEKNGILAGNDPETTEFNDIMNFLYMGRKEKIKEIFTALLGEAWLENLPDAFIPPSLELRTTTEDSHIFCDNVILNFMF